MSMGIGGFSLAALFNEPYAFMFAIYGFPFVILYGIPVAIMAHKLTIFDKRFPALKRLLVFIVMGGWLPAFVGTVIVLLYGQDEMYGFDEMLWVAIIAISMIFAVGFWLGEELFERTKIKNWTEPDLTKT